MAKKRTKLQIDADKVIKKTLNKLGDSIYRYAKKNSRVDTGRLRDSVNYRVKPDTVLTVAQVYYGKFQDPNELTVAIDKYLPKSVDLIVTEITDKMIQNFK